MIDKEIRISKRKRRAHLSPFAIMGVTFLSLYALMLILPIIWVIISSLKGRLDFRANPFGWPKEFMFSNYLTAFKELSVSVPDKNSGVRDVYMLEMFLYSLLYTLGTTISALIVKSVAAYVVAKYSKYFITKVVYAFVIFAMVMPIIGSLPSELQLLRAIGAYDNMIGMWVVKSSFLGMNFLILYATFRSISWEYAEAAQIDGATHFGIFIKIMLPFAKSTLFALGLLSFISGWNDYYTPMVFLPSYPTIAYGLFWFQNSSGTVASSVTLHFAACTLVMIPILILYFIFKEKLIGSVAIGGLKG